MNREINLGVLDRLSNQKKCFTFYCASAQQCKHAMYSHSVRPSVRPSVRKNGSCIFTARRVCIARTMPSQDVCLSVCLSVRLSHASIESKRLCTSSKFFLPSGSFTNLVCHYQTGWRYSDGDPLTGAPNAMGA